MCSDKTRSGKSPDRFSLPQSARFDCESIDREHHGLVDSLNQMAAEMAEAGSVQLEHFAAWLARLRDQMASHFESEEAVMVAVGFDGHAAHAVHHAATLSVLDGMHAQAHAGVEMGMDEVLELFHHILDDVLRADLPFKSFLEGRAVHRRR